MTASAPDRVPSAYSTYPRWQDILGCVTTKNRNHTTLDLETWDVKNGRHPMQEESLMRPRIFDYLWPYVLGCFGRIC